MSGPASVANNVALLDDVVSITEAAKLLRCSEAFVRAKLSSRELPRVKLGARTLVRKSDLGALLQVVTESEAA